jgi:hypothetical protein
LLFSQVIAAIKPITNPIATAINNMSVPGKDPLQNKKLTGNAVQFWKIKIRMRTARTAVMISLALLTAHLRG